ncbi:MAG: hypothetical protein WCG03_06545 [Kiritimatiellales bacterium]
MPSILDRELGFFGKIRSVKRDFGCWVFTGTDKDQPDQRPRWNYRAEDGGGIMIDLFCPWRYKGDQLAELGLQSWKERRWVDVPKLG